MSAPAAAGERTRTARARGPNGFPFGFYRYRNYVLFAATSVFMALGCVGLLEGLHALGQGPEAWRAWLSEMNSGPELALSTLVLGMTLYFAFRFGWVGRKIGAGRIGPVPPPRLPLPILGLAPLGGFVTLWLILLAILGGLVL